MAMIKVCMTRPLDRTFVQNLVSWLRGLQRRVSSCNARVGGSAVRTLPPPTSWRRHACTARGPRASVSGHGIDASQRGADLSSLQLLVGISATSIGPRHRRAKETSGLQDLFRRVVSTRRFGSRRMSKPSGSCEGIPAMVGSARLSDGLSQPIRDRCRC